MDAFYKDKHINCFTNLFDKSFKELDIDQIKDLIPKAEQQAENEKDLVGKMQLYYDIALAYADIRYLNQEEQAFEKEILNYRRAIEIYENNFEQSNDEFNKHESITNEKYIAMRTFCNLGNTFRGVHRYLSAITCFINALNISDDFAMASLNLSETLFEFSIFQTTDRATDCYRHAGYYYFKKAEQCKINLEGPQSVTELERLKSFWINRMEYEYSKEFLESDMQFPLKHCITENENNYRGWIALFRLFLNTEGELNPTSTFWEDNLVLPENSDKTEAKEYIGLFNQIKEEFITARYLWYLTTELREPKDTFIDRDTWLIDLSDTAEFSIRENMLRLSLKAAASLFDRIGFFINSYFDVGFKKQEIGFKKIWKDNRTVFKNGKKSQESVSNPLSQQRLDNPFLEAIYWLQKDFVQDEDVSLTSDTANRIVKMRNNMEHNCLRTIKNLGQKPNKVQFTIYTSEGQIEQNTFETIKLLHETIIYLVSAVNIKSEMDID